MEKFDVGELQTKNPELFDVLYWKYLHCFDEEIDRAKKDGLLEDFDTRMYEIFRYAYWNVGFHAFIQGFYEGEAANKMPRKKSKTKIPKKGKK